VENFIETQIGKILFNASIPKIQPVITTNPPNETKIPIASGILFFSFGPLFRQLDLFLELKDPLFPAKACLIKNFRLP